MSQAPPPGSGDDSSIWDLPAELVRVLTNNSEKVITLVQEPQKVIYGAVVTGITAGILWVFGTFIGFLREAFRLISENVIERAAMTFLLIVRDIIAVFPQIAEAINSVFLLVASNTGVFAPIVVAGLWLVTATAVVSIVLAGIESTQAGKYFAFLRGQE